MDKEQTQPIDDDGEVIYRCSCGAELTLDPDVGGQCPECQRAITAKVLSHDLALTMTIQLDDDPSSPAQSGIELGQTRADHPTADEDPSQVIGKRFGHFEIVDSLGRGGMGQVYRALDTSLQRYVAVKILRSGIGSTEYTTSSEAEIDALLQEAVSQARVTHPNIVTIYYVGKQDGDPFLAMELVNGSPLSKLVSARNLTFSHIAPIAIQIARALQFSFELDIIHGDIKPSNVLVQTNGLTKLSDFGMARRASDEDSGRIGGTPNYIAPELLTGEKPTIQSDMYALGVTLYEMTFGTLPVTLKGHTVPDWIESHEATEITFPNPWPENFPERWQNILQRLLAKDPSQRYESYESLLDALENSKPESRIIARRTPRLIAAAIDFVVVMLFVAPVQIAISIFSDYFDSHPVLKFLFHIADLIPIVAYTATVFFWRHSIGRRLMHVRVVNRYGLLPTQNVMAMRSVMRMILLWIICFAMLFGGGFGGWFDVVGNVLVVLAFVYLLLDSAFLMLYENGKSIHDLIFKTRVVVDTD